MTSGQAPRFALDLTGVTLLGVYRVVERLATGGMGTVWKAENVTLGTPAAVKVPDPALLARPGFRRRFEQEVRALTRFNHPNVVRILAAGEHDDVPFCVLEYLDGGSLKERLAALGGRQSPDEVLAWLSPVAEALDHLHAAGVVHRDVKPANLLFHARGHPVLSDFGIAKALSGDTTAAPTTSQLFTPTYAAPEQVLDDAGTAALTGQADQYALASTVFEALTGRAPFVGAAAEVIAAKIRDQAPDPRRFAAHLSAAAAHAVERALARDPRARHVSCAAFARAFAAGLPGPSDTRTAPTPVEAQRGASGLDAAPGRRLSVRASGADAERRTPKTGGRPPVAPARRWMLLAAAAGVIVVGAALLRSALVPGTAAGRASPDPVAVASAPPPLQAPPAGPEETDAAPSAHPSPAPVPTAPPPAPQPAPPPAPTVPPQPPDTQAPELVLLAPAEERWIGPEATVEIRGLVRDDGPVTLYVNGTPGEVAADGSFVHRVALEEGQVLTIALEAVDRAGKRSPTLTRVMTRQRRAPWELPLEAALAGMAADDGDVAGPALARAKAAGAPEARLRDLEEYVRLWNLPPKVVIESPLPGARLEYGRSEDGGPPSERSFTVRVRGSVLTGRRADRLHLGPFGMRVSLPQDRPLGEPYVFEADVSRPGLGETTLVAELRGADDRERVRATVVVVLAEASVAPRPIAVPERPPPVPVPLAHPALPTPKGSPDGKDGPQLNPAPSADDMAALAAVNKIRASHKLIPIRFDLRLWSAARAHSEEQLRGGYLGHEAKDPERKTLGQRMGAAGYVGRTYAEVVAKDYVSADAVVQAWMDSPRHREVLLDPDLTDGAFSRVDASDPRNNRWTGDFGDPGKAVSGASVPAPRVHVPPAVPSPAVKPAAPAPR